MHNQTIQDEAIGAYPIAYVSKENDYRWILNYPSGSMAIFPSERQAIEALNEHNQNQKGI